MQRKAKKQRPTAITEPAVDPGRICCEGTDWVDETPIMRYEMDSYDSPARNGVSQSIELTYDEYVALKAELARLRGLTAKEESHAA